MKKNIKTMGLLALLVSCLLMSFAIPAMAVTPPWMLARQDDMGGGGDPRIQPYAHCFTPKATISEFDIFEYYPTCDPCNQIVFGTPAVHTTCDLKD